MLLPLTGMLARVQTHLLRLAATLKHMHKKSKNITAQTAFALLLPCIFLVVAKQQRVWYYGTRRLHGALFLENFLLPKPKLLIEVPPHRPVPFIFNEPPSSWIFSMHLALHGLTWIHNH